MNNEQQPELTDHESASRVRLPFWLRDLWQNGIERTRVRVVHCSIHKEEL